MVTYFDSTICSLPNDYTAIITMDKAYSTSGTITIDNRSNKLSEYRMLRELRNASKAFICGISKHIRGM